MTEQSQILTAFGAEVKAVGPVGDDGLKVEGYLIRFGDPDSTDLEGDYFTPATDFGLEYATKSPVYFNHGLPLPTPDGNLVRIPDAVGEGELKLTDDGVLIEAVIYNRQRWERLVSELGWSSGTASHLVEREEVRPGVYRVKRWPLGLDASLTPIPADPRARVAVKALEMPEGGGGEAPPADGAVAEGEQQYREQKQEEEPGEEEEMTGELNIEELMKQMAERAAQSATEAVKALLVQEEDQHARQPQPEPEEEQGAVKSLRDFLSAVARKDFQRLEVYGVKAAMSGASGATGGYLIPDQFVPQILDVASEAAIVLPRATRFPTHGPLRQPMIDISGGASGIPAWFGGVQMYWHEEGAALTESEPAFESYTLADHGIGALAYVSNRLLNAAGVDVDGYIRRLLGLALGWFTDYYFLRGDGVGKPLGILNAPAKANVTRGTASDFKPVDASTMVSRLLPSSIGNAVWLMNPTVLPKLAAFSTGQMPIWQPNFREGLGGNLLGMPIIFTEKLPTLGTEGDVVLADFSYYGVLMPPELEIDVSEHYRFINDQTTYRINAWVDGQPMVKSSATLADGSTTVSPFVVLK